MILCEKVLDWTNQNGNQHLHSSDVMEDKLDKFLILKSVPKLVIVWN